MTSWCSKHTEDFWTQKYFSSYEIKWSLYPPSNFSAAEFNAVNPKQRVYNAKEEKNRKLIWGVSIINETSVKSEGKLYKFSLKVGKESCNIFV